MKAHGWGRRAQTDSGKQKAFSARYFGAPSGGRGVAMNKAGLLQEKELTPTLRLPRERQEFASHPYRFPCRYSRRRYLFRYRALRTSARLYQAPDFPKSLCLCPQARRRL